jgi:hypothetical protein
MFIERTISKRLLLAPAERNRGPDLVTVAGRHCAPLERGSLFITVSINIWLRWSQSTTGCRPRVARHELPWGDREKGTNDDGVESVDADATSLGGKYAGRVTQRSPAESATLG